jgi:excisionase family DNA binding protein
MPENMLSTKEAMDYLGIGRTKLYSYVADKQLTVYKSKTNAKASFFSRAELDKLKGFEPVTPPRAPEPGQDFKAAV